MVNALQDVQGKLIHISTDYVFDGHHNQPYTEQDTVNPRSVYGRTKSDGEKIVLESPIDAIVIRTSWLYSSFGSNFVKTMLRLGKEKGTINVVSDQIGSPTYARDLAKVCLKILAENNLLNTQGKLYHYSNEGTASWCDFAKAIMELAHIVCTVNPVQTKGYPTPAKRPFYTVLDKEKIKFDFGIEIPHWRNSLINCLECILKQEAKRLKPKPR